MTYERASSDVPLLSLEVKVVHSLMMDDIEVEIGQDNYGSLYARTKGIQTWMTCVGLEYALAKEILRLEEGVEKGR